MAKPRLPRKSVKMAEFASAELDRLYRPKRTGS
jgi:hypothetical protein